MADDGFLKNAMNNPNTKGAIEELMKSEEGRELAEKIRSKLKELNDQFKGLTGDDKKAFLDNFREKFSDSLGELKDTLKAKLGDSVNGEFKLKEDSGDEQSIPPTPSHYGPEQNYKLFIGAILIMLILFGFFGYKLYKSIMDKEMKREKKSKKELKKEKKTQSPPASPRSKKET